MKSVRTRVSAVLVVLASVTVGLIATQGSQAGATPLQYQCVGTTNDVAAKVASGLIWNGSAFVTNYVSYTSAGFLNYIQGLVSPFGGVVTTKPVLDANVTSNDGDAPAAAGSQLTRNFTASVGLPANLVSDASTYLGISSVALSNSTFSIAGTNVSPATFTSPIANQTVPLIAGQQITAPVTGTVTVANATGFATFVPGTAHVELLLDPTLYPNGKGKHIGSIYYNGTYIGTDFYVIGLRFNCNPFNGTPTVGYDQITGGATTTTLAPTTTTLAPTTTTLAPTTTTTTTLAPTTTTTTTLAPTTTTTTTLAPTTTTTTTLAPTTTTTTTLAPTTTTTTTLAPTTTTTTTLPATTTTTIPGQHTVNITVGGAGYANSGPVTSGSYTISPGNFVGGSGTIAGKNGGNATVSISIQKFLVWGFGTVTVTDPGAGLAPITGYVLFGPAPSGHTIAYGYSYVNGVFKSYTINLTIT